MTHGERNANAWSNRLSGNNGRWAVIATIFGGLLLSALGWAYSHSVELREIRTTQQQRTRAVESIEALRLQVEAIAERQREGLRRLKDVEDQVREMREGRRRP